MSEHNSKHRGPYTLETNGEEGMDAKFRVRFANGGYLVDENGTIIFGSAAAAHAGANSNPAPSQEWKPA